MVFDPDTEQLTKIRRAHHQQDPSVVKVLQGQKPGWREKDQIITFQERIYIPKDKSLRGGDN